MRLLGSWWRSKHLLMLLKLNPLSETEWKTSPLVTVLPQLRNYDLSYLLETYKAVAGASMNHQLQSFYDRQWGPNTEVLLTCVSCFVLSSQFSVWVTAFLISWIKKLLPIIYCFCSLTRNVVHFILAPRVAAGNQTHRILIDRNEIAANGKPTHQKGKAISTLTWGWASYGQVVLIVTQCSRIVGRTGSTSNIALLMPTSTFELTSKFCPPSSITSSFSYHLGNWIHEQRTNYCAHASINRCTN